jgi:DNA adenine methylase
MFRRGFSMKPLFIWAGGKNKMLKHYKPFMPKKINTYCEPFFGGGAMYIYVVEKYAPKELIINDVNSDIVRIYKTIKSDCDNFISILDELSQEYLPLTKAERKKYYYSLRHKHAYDYVFWDSTKEAAILYFLMKTGFNGIYQVNINTNNRYGTPSGLLNQKDKVYDKEVVEWWNKSLQHTQILSGDWKDCVSYIEDKEDNFTFLDPPYRGSFTSYGQEFSDSDQNKLVDFVTSQKESTVFLCNRDIQDGFYDNRNLIMDKFPVTYTAGRRKKTDDGFEAKPATEVLIRNK